MLSIGSHKAISRLRGADYKHLVVAFIGAAIVTRLVLASILPIAFDEALYWRYSKHLAAGFLDHPIMNPLMIRIGTTVFGDTPIGVRIVAVLLGIPASWAVWRAATSLSRDEKIGATAALLFNLTLVMNVGSLLATSDQVVVTTSSLLLYALAKVNETGNGKWWIAAGAAFGLGMCSKYTTAFFAVSILSWLILVPANRRWLLNPWVWIGGTIALSIFAPVIIWNMNHQWASIAYQTHRMVVHELTLNYLGELLAGQFGLATPPIFVLGCIGLFAVSGKIDVSARVLLACLVWPIAGYFAWHSLHQRVQGNWPESMYPAFVILAAIAAHMFDGETSVTASIALWSRRLALPVGSSLALFSYVQATTGIIPMGPKDPTARMLGVGWPQMAGEIDNIISRTGATAILGTEYQAVSWLTFYLPSHTQAEQVTQRIRWVNEPEPHRDLSRQKLLYICKQDCNKVNLIRKKFAVVELIEMVHRKRGNMAFETYEIYRVAQPTSPLFDPLYAELESEPAQ